MPGELLRECIPELTLESVPQTINLHMRETQREPKKIGVEQIAAGVRFTVTLLRFTVSFVNFTVSLGKVAF